jgi:hypothetical protein
MRRPDVPWGAGGDEEPKNPNGRWLQPPRGRASRKPQGAIRGGNLGTKGAQSPAERSEQEQRIPYRLKAPRAGKITTCHDGVVEAVLAALAESVKTNAHREKARTGIEARVATGVSEVRSP